MRVAFVSRATLYSSPGGDTQQLLMTAQCLRDTGMVTVDVYTADNNIDYSKYNLLHFFNIIRPADIIHHVKESGLPYLVSTIFVEYGQVREKRKGLMELVRKILSPDMLEYVKVVARSLKNGEKIVSKDYLLMGHRRAVKWVAQHAAMLLPNSESEYARFCKAYGIVGPYRVVPNGVDTEQLNKDYPELPAYKDAVLCMGRIESRKNQLNLIRALNNTEYRVFIHGKPSPNNIAYFNQCRQEAAANITIGPHLEPAQLYAAYSAAKVHVLPSYFETTGLSSLEAAAMGCNIVVTDKGDTMDYFGDNAWYCDPDDPGSIKNAVDAAFNAPYNEKFRQYILTHYTWEAAAKETLEAYKTVPGVEEMINNE
ncbi:glycosyltransferase family 4 protein [Chitinophagaceae bacterium MMS25-I14]